MPIPNPPQTFHSLLPSLSQAQIDAARTSAWYETFIEITPKSTIIDLNSATERDAFLEWLDADSIFIPQDNQLDSQEQPQSQSTHDEVDDEDSDDEAPVYHLPKLNEAIRQALRTHNGAVFPKLNWSAPKDAAFILPQTSTGPLHCTSPADVYLLLKSSDFISHGIEPSTAYASGEDDRLPEGVETGREGMKIELVLKEYIDVNPSRELRCFVRNNTLIGICQRDTNHYDHLRIEDTRITICDTIRAFWEDEIRGQHPALGQDYIFDVHLTPNLDDAMIIDFNPYRPSTDPLLFSYPELHSIFLESQQPVTDETTSSRARLPILKVIDSPAHPEATRAAPAYGGNMMPIEMIEMSQGRSMAEFTEAWNDALARGMSE